MHIAVSGNIASGKTTLAEKLARHYHWTPLFESVDQNPYLADFYKDMKRWAFHLQIHFLNSRFNQVKIIRELSGTVIQDRTIYEDGYIFAANLYKSGLITDRNYNNYLDMFNSMLRNVRPPDLLIYLKSDIPKLVAQIKKRGREYENQIQLDYLNNLNDLYKEWIDQYTLGELLIVDINHLDFESNIQDFTSIIDRIDSKI